MMREQLKIIFWQNRPDAGVKVAWGTKTGFVLEFMVIYHNACFITITHTVYIHIYLKRNFPLSVVAKYFKASVFYRSVRSIKSMVWTLVSSAGGLKVFPFSQTQLYQQHLHYSRKQITTHHIKYKNIVLHYYIFTLT